MAAATNKDQESKYKASDGRYLTMALFRETNVTSAKPVWTLQKYDFDDTPSLYKIYMEMADPTEYKVALATVGSWEHWQRLTETGWFMKHLKDWREELRVKLQSAHYDQMVEISKTGKTASERTAALKWLAQHSGYETKEASLRGRPSKTEIANKLKQELRSLDEVSEDAERLGLH